MKIPHLLIAAAFAAMFMSANLSLDASAQTSGKTVKRVKGTVKSFNDAKGIGFITGESGEEFYFNKASTKGYSFEGQCVTFEIRSSPKGPVAKRVRGCPGSKPPLTGPIPFPTPSSFVRLPGPQRTPHSFRDT
jgi:CspA family cold shock protein